MLVCLGLQSGLGLDAVSNFDCSVETHFRFQLKATAQVRLNQDELVGSCLPDSPRSGAWCARGIPHRPHFLRWLFVDHHRPGHKVSKPAALAVAHHADQTDSVNSGQDVDGSHQIPPDCFESIDGASTFFDHANTGIALTGRLPLPPRFEDGEISPVDAKANKNGRGRPHQLW